MRSRSSTIASRWTCSCSRAFSMAMPACRANISTSRWSSSVKSPRRLLVGQVQVADRAALGADRDAEEASASAGGWAGSRSGAGRWRCRRSRARGASRMIRPEQAVAVRRRRRSRSRSAALMPLVMNRSMRPSWSTMPRAAYSRADELANAVDDELQDALDRAGTVATGRGSPVVERVEARRPADGRIGPTWRLRHRAARGRGVTGRHRRPPRGEVIGRSVSRPPSATRTRRRHRSA